MGATMAKIERAVVRRGLRSTRPLAFTALMSWNSAVATVARAPIMAAMMVSDRPMRLPHAPADARTYVESCIVNRTGRL